jgi:hypothetical protein
MFESKMSRLEKIYFGNDIKGGLVALLGEEFKEGVYPGSLILPPEIQAKTAQLLNESILTERAVKFFFDQGKWQVGTIHHGPDSKIRMEANNNGGIVIGYLNEARQYGVSSSLEQIYGKVPVIDFHTHPQDVYYQVLLPLFKQKFPDKDSTFLEKVAEHHEATGFFQSGEDIELFTAGQRRGAIQMVKGKGGTIMLVRKEIKVPWQELSLVVTSTEAKKLYEQLNEVEFSLDELDATNQNQNQTDRLRHLRVLHQVGEAFGFVVYYNFDPTSPELHLYTGQTEL